MPANEIERFPKAFMNLYGIIIRWLFFAAEMLLSLFNQVFVRRGEEVREKSRFLRITPSQFLPITHIGTDSAYSSNS